MTSRLLSQSHRHPNPVSALQTPSVWRRRRWADGRLISGLDDGIPAKIKAPAWFLALVGFWLYGQSGFPAGVIAPDSWIVWLLLLSAMSCSYLVYHARTRQAAARGWPPTAPAEATPSMTPTTAGWWRAARWPDGRFVACGDPVTVLAGAAAIVSLFVSVWLFGHMGVPDLGFGWSWGAVGTVCTWPVLATSIVSNRRLTALAEADAVRNAS